VELSNVLASAMYNKAELITATTLAKARHHLRQKHFELIILDIGMPDGNGQELLKDIEGSSPTPPPIVILSADMPPQEIHERVDTTIVKSRMSETKLIATILGILQKFKGGFYVG